MRDTTVINSNILLYHDSTKKSNIFCEAFYYEKRVPGHRGLFCVLSVKQRGRKITFARVRQDDNNAFIFVFRPCRYDRSRMKRSTG